MTEVESSVCKGGMMPCCACTGRCNELAYFNRDADRGNSSHLYLLHCKPGRIYKYLLLSSAFRDSPSLFFSPHGVARVQCQKSKLKLSLQFREGSKREGCLFSFLSPPLSLPVCFPSSVPLWKYQSC